MTYTIKLNHILTVTLILLIAFALALFYRGANQALGDSSGQLPANISTTTVLTVTATANPGGPIFATSTFCLARIVTTGSSSARMLFDERQGMRPAASIGVFQAASSTVTYPAENYGCNAVFLYIYTGVSTIFVTETK